MIGFGKMHSYSGKVAGLVLAGVGIALWVIHNLIEKVWIEQMTVEQQGFMFWWVALFGLYLAAFSKEKNDDERVKFIRGKAMLASFNLVVAFLLALSITAFIEDGVRFDAYNLLIIPSFCILFYLFLFHFALYSGSLWVFKDDTAPQTADKKNKNLLPIILYIVSMILLIIFGVYKNSLAI